MKRFISIILALNMLIGTTFVSAEQYIKGINTHFPYFSDSEKDLDLIYETGADTIRDTVNWTAVEYMEGVYNWENYDWWLNELNEKGKDIYVVVASINPPSFYYEDNTKAFFTTQKEKDGFCRFLKALIKRYPFIDYIELWNEPNLGFGTKATKEERMQCYADMVKVASETIREASEDMEIVAGCVAVNDSSTGTNIDGIEFLNYIMPQIYPYVDSISWHTYAVKRSAENSLVQNRIDNVKNVMASVGGWKKIYISETGWVTGDVDNVSVSEDSQAYNIAKIFPVIEENDINGTLIYDFRNDGEDLTNAEHNFGLINYDRTPKKSYSYFKDHIEKTKGYTHVGEYSKQGKEVHLYLGENDALTMSWTSPILSYTSYEPSYTTGITMSEAKSLFKNILSSKYSNLSNKVSGYGIDISGEMALINNDISNGNEEKAFNGNFELGLKLLNKKIRNEINVSAQELSELLNEIYFIGERMSVVFDISKELKQKNVDSLSRRYDALNDLTESYEDETVRLSKAILNAGEEKFDLMKENICVKKNGENYSLSGNGQIKIFGTAKAGSIISVRIKKDGEVVFVDTTGSNVDDKYEFIYDTDSDGVYEVAVSDSKGNVSSFVIEREELVLVEEYIKADYLEDFASQMLLVNGYDDVITFIEKEDKSALFNIQNGSKEQEIWVLLGGYKDGVLVGGAEQKVTLSAGEIKNITLAIEGEIDSIRGYVWRGDTMQPLKTVID